MAACARVPPPGRRRGGAGGRAPACAMRLPACLVALLAPSAALAQLSAPLASDSSIDVSGNKFLQRQGDSEWGLGTGGADEPPSGYCEQNVELRWTAEVGSSGAWQWPRTETRPLATLVLRSLLPQTLRPRGASRAARSPWSGAQASQQNPVQRSSAAVQRASASAQKQRALQSISLPVTLWSRALRLRVSVPRADPSSHGWYLGCFTTRQYTRRPW